MILAQDILYQVLDNEPKPVVPEPGDINYWLFSPGENAKMWDEFYTKSYMALGWTALGDLSQYESRDAIETRLKEISDIESSKKHDALANWQFKTVMKPGDIVIVKQGRKTLLGYGVVKSDYYFAPYLDHYQKCREVDWKLKGVWPVDHDMVTKTLTIMTEYPTKHPDYKYYYQRLLAIMGSFGGIYVPFDQEGTDIDNPVEDHIFTNHPLNQILFGPPGTGKTYNSINYAVQIADPGFMQLPENAHNRDKITKRYKKLVNEGRIVFTTFHQSMSYEDFIEGIKPVTNEDQENNLTYEVVPGIFKRFCAKAAMSDDNNFEQSYSKLITELDELKDEFTKAKTPSGNDFGISLNSNNNLSLHLGKEFRKHGSLTKDIMIAHILGKDVPVYFKGYYQGVIALLKAKYGFDDKRIPGENYVLIIDEINRGNISQIFGELITLIEPDKRAGNKEALEVTLPYSKEKFSVPSNLYIIGTMNTADRSVEALDTALRRRFSFVEFKPDYSLLEGTYFEDISLKTLLETLNLRIEGLLDKDHAIGHSYFLRVAALEISLKQVFFKEIIPLLQEYFYGNYGRLELVLGKGFVISSPITQDIYAVASYDNDDFTEHLTFSLVRENEQNDDAFLNALLILLNR